MALHVKHTVLVYILLVLSAALIECYPQQNVNTEEGGQNQGDAAKPVEKSPESFDLNLEDEAKNQETNVENLGGNSHGGGSKDEDCKDKDDCDNDSDSGSIDDDDIWWIVLLSLIGTSLIITLIVVLAFMGYCCCCPRTGPVPAKQTTQVQTFATPAVVYNEYSTAPSHQPPPKYEEHVNLSVSTDQISYHPHDPKQVPLSGSALVGASPMTGGPGDLPGDSARFPSAPPSYYEGPPTGHGESKY